jgi:hypothetical protein
LGAPVDAGSYPEPHEQITLPTQADELSLQILAYTMRQQLEDRGGFLTKPATGANSN